MRMSRPPTVAFHALASLGSGGAALALREESRHLAGRAAQLELACAAAALAACLGSAVILVRVARAGPAIGLRSRATSFGYLQVLAATLSLALMAQRARFDGRQALAVFALFLAAWVLGIGLQLVPGLALASAGLVSNLGRVSRFSELEWLTLVEHEGERRVTLSAGRGRDVLVRVRLLEPDARRVRERAALAGLRDGPT